jgi:hypothetical protein
LFQTISIEGGVSVSVASTHQPTTKTIADREAIQAAAALLRALGKTPSIRTIAAVLKAADGKRAIRWSVIAEALKCCPATVPATATQQHGNDSEHDGQHHGNTVATPTRAPADLKGVSKIVPIVQGELLNAPSGALPHPRQKRASSPPSLLPRPDPRSPAEQRADEAIALLRERLEPLLVGMTWSTWRTRNRRVVVDMVRAGFSPEDIDTAHDEIRDREGQPFVVMAWFQERLAARESREVPEPVKIGIDFMSPEQRRALTERELARRREAGEL